MTRLGLYGGTFDPIHRGHLDVAHAARRALSLDALVFMPANVPPHRSPPQASAPHRFAMAAMGALGEPGVTVSDVEMLGPGPSYTASTLDGLERLGIIVRDVWMVTGADTFADIASWKTYPDLLDRCHFVVVSRPGQPAPALRSTLATLASRMIDAPVEGGCEVPPRPSIFLVDAPTAPVSSTEIRRLVAAGRPIDGLVPSAVAAHIGAHRLYSAREGVQL